MIVAVLSASAEPLMDDVRDQLFDGADTMHARITVWRDGVEQQAHVRLHWRGDGKVLAAAGSLLDGDLQLADLSLLTAAVDAEVIGEETGCGRPARRVALTPPRHEFPRAHLIVDAVSGAPLRLEVLSPGGGIERIVAFSADLRRWTAFRPGSNDQAVLEVVALRRTAAP